MVSALKRTHKNFDDCADFGVAVTAAAQYPASLKRDFARARRADPSARLVVHRRGVRHNSLRHSH